MDTETGEVEVTKVVNVNDVGKAISPETVEGQMYGGTYMGVGRALTEEMVWDPQTGVLLNRQSPGLQICDHQRLRGGTTPSSWRHSWDMDLTVPPAWAKTLPP